MTLKAVPPRLVKWFENRGNQQKLAEVIHNNPIIVEAIEYLRANPEAVTPELQHLVAAKGEFYAYLRGVTDGGITELVQFLQLAAPQGNEPIITRPSWSAENGKG